MPQHPLKERTEPPPPYYQQQVSISMERFTVSPWLEYKALLH